MAETETGYAEGWKPNPGDEVGGKLVDIAITENGWGPYPVLTLRDEGGTEIAVHAFHDVLKEELARRRPKFGDELSIKYLGQPEGKRYHAYRVRGGEVGEFNWDRFSSTPQEQVSSSGDWTPPPDPAPAPAPQPVPKAVVPDDGDDDMPF